MGGGNQDHFGPFHSGGLGIAGDQFGGSLSLGLSSFLGRGVFVLGWEDCGSSFVVVE